MNRVESPRCEGCGAPLRGGTSFCPSCGRERDAPPATQAASAPKGSALPPVKSPPPFRPATKPPRTPLDQPLPPVAEPRRRGRVALLVAAVLLALGAVAGATVFVAQRESADGQAVPVPTRGGSSGTVKAGGGNGYPPVERGEMEAEIETLLRTFHEDLVAGDFRSAWALLSPRKRRQFLGEGGFRPWMTAQASLSPHLSPSGLAARLDSLEGEGVARVTVTGMGWSRPGSSCSEWSGLTWVRYQGGQWTYDPGYSTTPARRRTWEPRSSELLGIGC